VFDEHGVDTRGLKLTDDAPTSCAVALVNPQGQRVFIYSGGANDSFCFSDIDTALLDGYSHVHVSGTYNLPAFDGAGCAEFFSLARDKGKMTSMDVTWDTSGRWLSIIEPCLPHLNLFLPSETEARQITGRTEPEHMAAFLRGAGVETAVIKLGDKGAYVESAEEGFYQPAYKTSAVDTTGAGDCFAAGFIYFYAMERPLRECAKFASGAASYCVRAVGATDGVPNAEEVLELTGLV
jgi:sugar/nucleoside kinase (ribokinase family)